MVKNFLILLLVVAGLAAGYVMSLDSNTVVLDNAYVSGKIIKIRAPKDGIIETVLIEHGSTVNERDILFAYDKRSAELSVQKASQAFHQSIKDELQACFEESIAKEKLSSSDLVSSFKKDRLERGKKLSSANLLAEDTFEDLSLGYSVAMKEKSIAQLEWSVMGYATNEAILSRTKVMQAKNTLEEELHNQRLQEVRSPRTGYIYTLNIYAGQYVDAGDLIAVLVATDDIRVEANVLETKIASLKPGMRAKVYSDVNPQQVYKGVVHSIVPSTAASFSPIPRNNTDSNWIKVSQRVPVIVSLLDEGAKTLPIGSSAKVELLLDEQLDSVEQRAQVRHGYHSLPNWQKQPEDYIQKIVAAEQASFTKYASNVNCRL
ncbi:MULTISPECIES: HlyD family secretion protein [Pseudoalteromonas]|uniref:Uncharacterized protein n=1 Tax=Pseudoalteromonas amylolytica TaxID=1859457 RepID=A0A1S1MSN1_9GAMM|nr:MULTISPECIES: HlyD family efflux transporter periplasmic adaptor subunit [Pseudoalteromonas]MCF6436494.1 HlyD family efflux transporter periplasmic adaptor subunit [Pseudoalteromonas sp. MMG022]OHU86158.1 hypothetical protein BFC16_15725 [Pseudoalteromonas sp. JW3]OHU89735.1 hypothetical protein BET10_16590 [Pseudoalteromonas amylolytica]